MHYYLVCFVLLQYLGSFPVGGGEVSSRAEVSTQLQLMKVTMFWTDESFI